MVREENGGILSLVHGVIIDNYKRLECIKVNWVTEEEE